MEKLIDQKQYLVFNTNKIHHGMRNLSFTGEHYTFFKLYSIFIMCLSCLLPQYAISSSTGEIISPEKKLQSTITGTITSSDDGMPIPGVSVIIKGTTTGTVTDFDGVYSLEAPSSSSILVFSYVGFKTQEVPVTDSNTIDIVLEPDVTNLDEVVLVGYGTKRKRDIVSAVSVVDLEEVKDVPASDASRLLVGQAPGVNVQQSTGRPGQELNVTIRGIGSLGATSRPLYVVDGFPLGTSLGQTINPSDIESITVLKDAASTAIYGARGSNGVILINTKKGKEGKTNVSLDVTSGLQSIPNESRTKMMNAMEFGQFQKESYIDRFIFNEGRAPTESEIPLRIRNPENNTISTDWFDEIANDAALFKNYNLNISSGNEKTTSVISLGYTNQDGVIIKTNFERFNVRANVDTKITDDITIGLNVSGSRSNERYISDGSRNAVIGISLWADPREPVYYDDGGFNDYLGGNGIDGDLIFGSLNPVQLLYEEKNTRKISRFLANSYAEFNFLKDFKFKTSVNISLENVSLNEFRPSTLATNGFNSPPPRLATLNEGYTEDVNWSTDQLLSYSKVVNEDHNIEALLGYTAQEDSYRTTSIRAEGFPDDEIRFLQNGESITVRSGDNGLIPGNGLNNWSLLAYFARVNYNYKGRYLFSGTYRREGSSRFGSDNRWGNFPALSVGWRLSDEAFLKDVSWLTDLKLRGSFGVTGNNNIGNYTSLSTLRDENYILGGNFEPGKVLNSLANVNLGWEESKQYDYGVDLALFDNKLTLTGEYYLKTTENMLLPVSIPVISGFETIFTNIGKVENTGLEFALGYQNKISDNLSIRSNFNISFNRNKVLEIDGDNDEIRVGGDFYGANNVSRVGRPVGMLHGYRNLGLFNSVEEINAAPPQDGAIPGQFRYFDGNGDGEISYDTQDWVEIGNPHPEFVWGFNLGLDYKAFDFNTVFTGAQNYDVYRNIESTTLNMDGIFNVETRAKDRFRYTTMSAEANIPTTVNFKWEREANSFYIHDASHIWLRNVSLGYTLPLKPDSFIRSTRIYLNVDNAYIFTDYIGGNPEVNTSGGIAPGVDNSAYPLPRTFTLGASLNF